MLVLKWFQYRYLVLRVRKKRISGQVHKSFPISRDSRSGSLISRAISRSEIFIGKLQTLQPLVLISGRSNSDIDESERKTTSLFDRPWGCDLIQSIDLQTDNPKVPNLTFMRSVVIKVSLNFNPLYVVQMRKTRKTNLKHFVSFSDGHLQITNCSTTHNLSDLCCKMGAEFDGYYKSNKK